MTNFDDRVDAAVEEIEQAFFQLTDHNDPVEGQPPEIEAAATARLDAAIADLCQMARESTSERSQNAAAMRLLERVNWGAVHWLIGRMLTHLADSGYGTDLPHE